MSYAYLFKYIIIGDTGRKPNLLRLLGFPSGFEDLVTVMKPFVNQ